MHISLIELVEPLTGYVKRNPELDHLFYIGVLLSCYFSPAGRLAVVDNWEINKEWNAAACWCMMYKTCQEVLTVMTQINLVAARVFGVVLAIVIVPVIAVSGASTTSEVAPGTSAVAPSRAEVEAFYSYDAGIPLDVKEIPLGSSPWYREYEISYANLGDTVYSRFMLPWEAGASFETMNPMPCLVGLHGMFSDSAYQFWTIADFCAKRKVAVMTPSLPYHHKRTKGMPLIPGQQLIVGSPDAIRNNLRRAVIDVRRAVDWLATRDDIDQGAISIAGVSLGGIVASLAFKVEPRFANAVLVVAGSGVRGILENGDTSVLDVFRAATWANMVNPDDFVDALQIVDPINVPDFQPRPALLMNGISDAIMVPDNVTALRRSMARAEQIWTTGGHYFPMYPAEYLLMDYLSRQYAESPSFAQGIRVDVGSGFCFTERVCAPEVGADNLWVDIAVELGSPEYVAAHRVSVPMVNRSVPVIILSRETYLALEPFLMGRHLPAFIYIINGDSPLQLCAAVAYVQALGLGADPQLYYVSPLEDSENNPGQEGYAVCAASPMDVGRVRNMLESIARAPGSRTSGGFEKANARIPLTLFGEAKRFQGPTAREDIGLWFAKTLSVSKLKGIPWFPNYPHDDPCWSAGPDR